MIPRIYNLCTSSYIDLAWTCCLGFLTVAAPDFKKDVIPLIHPSGGTKKTSKKKVVKTIQRNSLHNLERKVVAPKGCFDYSPIDENNSSNWAGAYLLNSCKVAADVQLLRNDKSLNGFGRFVMAASMLSLLFKTRFTTAVNHHGT